MLTPWGVEVGGLPLDFQTTPTTSSANALLVKWCQKPNKYTTSENTLLLANEALVAIEMSYVTQSV